MQYSFEVIDWVDTPIGTISLRRREVPTGEVTEVMIDNELLMSSLNTISERALATCALGLHPEGKDLRVLVGGLGLGYTAQQALKDPRVGHVRVVDRLPTVIGWLRDGKVPLSRELTADPRVEIVEGDVYAELLGPGTEEYDLVLVDVDHAPGSPLDPASEPFYTWQGQRQVIEHLAPGGVLGVWSAEDDRWFADALAEVWPFSAREHIRWNDEHISNGEEIHEVIFLARRAD